MEFVDHLLGRGVDHWRWSGTTICTVASFARFHLGRVYCLRYQTHRSLSLRRQERQGAMHASDSVLCWDSLWCDSTTFAPRLNFRSDCLFNNRPRAPDNDLHCYAVQFYMHSTNAFNIRML